MTEKEFLSPMFTLKTHYRRISFTILMKNHVQLKNWQSYADYVEDSLRNLLKREAIIEPAKGKYQTDFIIWSDKYGIYCEENAEKALMPIMDNLLSALRKITKEAMKIDFYKAEKSENDLLYLFGVLAFAYAGKKYCSLPFPSISATWKPESISGSESVRSVAQIAEAAEIALIQRIILSTVLHSVR